MRGTVNESGTRGKNVVPITFPPQYSQKAIHHEPLHVFDYYK
jgi:hypothetical protein